ncbi:MAG: hypothetical protein ACO4AI_07710 [Prochlorothrix sp.]|nr:hypothetical protein [Prochlorothrix sp.]
MSGHGDDQLPGIQGSKIPPPAVEHSLTAAFIAMPRFLSIA